MILIRGVIAALCLAGLGCGNLTDPNIIDTTPAGGDSELPAPTVSSITPISGPPRGGTIVAIRGRHFRIGLSVKFGEITVRNAIVDDSTIALSAPPQGAGVVDIVVINADSTSATLKGAYTYVPVATSGARWGLGGAITVVARDAPKLKSRPQARNRTRRKTSNTAPTPPKH